MGEVYAAMIPDGALSNPPVPAEYLPPDDSLRADRLEDFCSGGRDFGDPLPSLFAEDWKFRYNRRTATATVERLSDNRVTELFTLDPEVYDVGDISGCWNQNMDWNVVVGYDQRAAFRWFDAATGQHEILNLTGVCSARVTLDDKRRENLVNADVLLFYLRGITLHYRQQRDRFENEYSLGSFPGVLGIDRVGMTLANRVQIELLYSPNWQDGPDGIGDYGACDGGGSSVWAPCP